MVTYIEQWCARIGLFAAESKNETFTVYDDLSIVNYKVFALIIVIIDPW